MQLILAGENLIDGLSVGVEVSKVNAEKRLHLCN
jgi:hypothetical protein